MIFDSTVDACYIKHIEEPIINLLMLSANNFSFRVQMQNKVNSIIWRIYNPICGKLREDIQES